MLREVLWYPGIEMHGIWSISEVVELLGVEEFKEFHQKRIKKDIWINIVWPQDKTLDTQWLLSDPEQKRAIRVLPQQVSWDMGYWIFGDKVLFISSQRELFGFVVQSKGFAALMKAQFDVLWGLSKEFKNKK